MAAAERCEACYGTGDLHIVHDGVARWIDDELCPECHGEGSLPVDGDS